MLSSEVIERVLCSLFRKDKVSPIFVSSKFERVELKPIEVPFILELIIFSKPENYQPVYRIRDKSGNETFNYGDKSEQFINMF